MDLVVVGVEGLGHQVGIEVLVAGFAVGSVEADAKRGQPMLTLLGEQRHHHRGVDAAGQQHTDRHVGDHPAFHAGTQRVHQRGLPVAGRPGRLVRIPTKVGVPVDGVGVRTVWLDHPHRCRGQLAHAAVNGARRRHHRVECHVVVQRLAIQIGVHAAGFEQCTYRRCEPQSARRGCQIQRLDTQPVTRHGDHPGVTFGDDEREHALEAVDATRPPFVKSLDHDLAVSGREEAIAVGLKLLT